MDYAQERVSNVLNFACVVNIWFKRVALKSKFLQLSQQTITCSKSTTETLEKNVKYFQS